MATPYAHVFEQMPNILWPRMETHRLSYLHQRFWGKQIEQDEHKWLEEQGAGAQHMDVDSDETEVASGSFLLDLGIDSSKRSKLWVRKDYIRLYDRCKTHLPKDGSAPSVVITGQPGIGKTYWILYAVRRRLGESEPFIWYFGEKWYLFVEDGVFQCPGPLPATDFRPFIWTFIDAGNCSSIPPDVAVLFTNVFTIFSTSPKRNRWKPLEKGTGCLTVIMNPWTWEEIIHATVIHEFTGEQRHAARNVFNEYGPIPRFCINFIQDQDRLSSHRARVRSAISNLSLDRLLKIVQESDDLDMDSSHLIFLVRRAAEDLVSFTISPITEPIRKELRSRLMLEERRDLLRVYERFKRVEHSRHLAGLVFEAMAQLDLQKEVTLNLVPMLKEPPALGKRTANWVSQIGADAANTSIPIRFTPEKTIEYEGSTPREIESGGFYVPKASNQVAFDSFILNDDILYIFQILIAKSHEIKAGIMNFFFQRSLSSIFQTKHIHFVFIIPPEGKITCPESNDTKLAGFRKKVMLFSAEFNPRDRAQLVT